MTKKQLVTLILVLAVVAAGVAAWVASTRQSEPVATPVAENGNIPITPAPANGTTEPTTTPEVITSDIDTSDWKTYRNEEVGFEVKYPGEWEYDTRGSGFVEFKDRENKYFFEGSETYLIGVSVVEIGDSVAFNDWIKDWADNRIQYGGWVKNVMINSINAVQGQDYLGRQTIIHHGNKRYSITQVNLGSPETNAQIENIYNALLNSWKFSN